LLIVMGAMLPGVLPAASRDLLSLPLEELSRLEVNVATGTPKTLASTPAATSLILRRDFRAMGAQTVEEALQAVPGLHVAPHGGLVGSTRFFIRGIASGSNTQTLFLVNGIPMTTLLQGNSTPSLTAPLPLQMVERIEVIRGPGSALYGPDAFAGVINVITRDADSLHVGAAGASVGSFDTAQAYAAGGGRVGALRLGSLLSYSGTRGDRALITADAQTVSDNALGTSASLAPGTPNRERQRLDFYNTLQWQGLSAHIFWHEVWNYGVQQGFGNALDPWGELALSRYGADVAWQDDGPGHWDFEARLAWMHTGIRSDEPVRQRPPNAFPGFPDGLQDDFELLEDRLHVEATALWHGWATHRLRFGAGVSLNDLYEVTSRRNYFYTAPGVPPSPYPQGLTDVSDTPGAIVAESTRKGAFAYAQDEWSIGHGWELTSGVRYGHYSDFGEVFSPRLALVWRATPQLTGKLLYGEAFRAPAFTELYATSSPLALGNPNLRPERLRSAEVGLSWRPAEQWSVDANVYEFRIRDFIDFLPAASPATLMAQNAGRYRGRGIELELMHRQNGFDLRANASVQETVSETSGDALGLAPRWQAYLRLGRALAPAWELSGQLRRIGPRARQPGDPQADLAGHTSLDLALRHRAGDSAELYLLGRNVFDADMNEPGITPVPERIPLPGASLVAGIELAW
jgi:iron complex outermembrane receptor protein